MRSVGVQLGLEANAFTVAMMMVGWVGVTELGAHQIVMNLASFTFMVPHSFSAAWLPAITRTELPFFKRPCLSSTRFNLSDTDLT